jgi:hypothetical protein
MKKEGSSSRGSGTETGGHDREENRAKKRESGASEKNNEKPFHTDHTKDTRYLLE